MFAASKKLESLNHKLAIDAEKILLSHGIAVELAAFSEFDVPLYNADMEANLPKGAEDFISKLQAADATIMFVPEYNYAIPGVLKNLFDWVSRKRPQPFEQKHILLGSASPSLVGGNRGLWSTRVPLEACRAFVYPEMFSLAKSHEALLEHDGKWRLNLEALLMRFIKHVQR